MNLQDILDQKKKDFEANASDYIKKIYGEGIQDVTDSGVLNNAKQIGDKAPDFKLKNALGKTTVLADYLLKGPVVLTWYRGGWCPYCNLTLQRLQQELPEFRASGANLLALTPELPDNSISTTEKNKLEFEVLSDIGNTVAKSYGIIFKLIQSVANKYQDAFDLHKYNGDETDELPLAATYIIDQKGIIRYAFLNADYRNRAEPSEIAAALKNL